jgi:hypothetical protein
MLTEFKSFLEACLADKEFTQLDSVKDMMSDIEDTHYFVIPEVYQEEDYDNFRKGHIDGKLSINKDNFNVNGIKIPETLDLPFRRCFFQCQENEMTFHNSVTYEEMANIMGFGGSKNAIGTVLSKYENKSIHDYIDTVDIKFQNLYVYEVEPKYIRVVATVKFIDTPVTVPISFSFKDGKLGAGKSELSYIYEEMVIESALSVIRILETINHKSWTVVSNDTPVKVKTRVGRKLTKYKYKPSTVIYVSTKQKFCARHPELSHRIINKPNYAYEVRGHWRRLQYHQIGKDREGLRGVKGFTWVTPFTKGEGEVMKKVRIVK